MEIFHIEWPFSAQDTVRWLSLCKFSHELNHPLCNYSNSVNMGEGRCVLLVEGRGKEGREASVSLQAGLRVGGQGRVGALLPG